MRKQARQFVILQVRIGLCIVDQRVTGVFCAPLSPSHFPRVNSMRKRQGWSKLPKLAGFDVEYQTNKETKIAVIRSMLYLFDEMLEIYCEQLKH